MENNPIRNRLPHLAVDSIYYIVYQELRKFQPQSLDESSEENSHDLRLFSYITYGRYFGRESEKLEPIKEATNVPEEYFPDIAHQIYYWQETSAAIMLGGCESNLEDDRLSSTLTVYTMNKKMEVKPFSSGWKLLPDFKPIIHMKKEDKIKQEKTPSTSYTLKSILKNATPNTPIPTPLASLMNSLSPTATPAPIPDFETDPFIANSEDTQTFDLTFPGSLPSPVQSKFSAVKANFPPPIKSSVPASKPAVKKKRVAGF